MSGAGAGEPVLTRLRDGRERTARELVADLGLRDGARPDGRPTVAAVMIASLDGRIAVQGRSVALGHPADRALLREMRAGADAILVGTATLAAERYANLLDPDQRERRLAAGLPAHPIVATISRRLELPVEIPLFSEPDVEIVVFTESDAPAPEVGARLAVERFTPGTLRPADALRRLGERGVRGVSCEGGAKLLRLLVAAGVVDHLLLTVAPLLVGGEASGLLDGAPLDPPARLALRDVHRADDHVFLHYGAGS